MEIFRRSTAGFLLLFRRSGSIFFCFFLVIFSQIGVSVKHIAVMQKSIFGGADIDKRRLQHRVKIDYFAEIDISCFRLGAVALDEILLKSAVVHEHHTALHQLAVEDDLFFRLFFTHNKKIRKIFDTPRRLSFP